MSWVDGGVTSLQNTIVLCGAHRLTHHGPWQIRRTRPADFGFDPPPDIRRTNHTTRPPPDG